MKPLILILILTMTTFGIDLFGPVEKGVAGEATEAFTIVK